MPEDPMRPLGPAVVVAVALAALVGIWFGRPEDPRMADAADPAVVTTVPVTSSPAITVHVAGEVARPGLVELPVGSRVADAVAGAGGATARASLIGINLAQEVVDGQQVVVPASGGSVTANAEDGRPIRLNSAGADQLEALPGVGPVLAAAIVSHRDEHGPFTAVEDLLSVAGIGEAKLAHIRDHVSVP